MSKKIFFIIFIVIIVIFIAFLFYRDGIFSKEILKLEILGPDTAKIGDEIEYTVQYKNNGNFVLEKPKLTFVLPDNSLTEDGKTIVVQSLNDIYPGNQDSVKFKVRLLGKDGDLKTAKASLSYVPKNITATYESNTTFITKIDSSSINLDFDLPTKVERGKSLQYSINYFSNVDYPLENLSIKVDPTSGFDFVSSDPKSLDNSEWKLQTLNKAQGGRISIIGKVSATNNQNLTFSASLGMWQNGNFVVIKQTSVDVQVIQPLLFISQQVNGSDSYVASPGEVLHYKIFFRNIGATPFDDLFMVVKLDSPALDMSTIKADSGGQSQSNDNMIVWDHSRVSQLAHLDVQQEGEVDFSVKVKSDWNPGIPSGLNDVNSTIITDEVNVSQITQKFTIKVNSGLVISQRGYYKSSDISNSGPIPPETGEVTTYTINWEIKDYFSDSKNVKVKATLPKNISLTGQIVPQDELSNFSFDSESKEIVWSVGNIQANTGVNGDPVILSFQVSLTPDNSQKGTTAQLIGQVQISGENQFTNTTITSQDAGINTSLPDDFANSGGGIIQ
ncbi:MAG: hypothetical protein NT094_01975 [Candidatus Staskawiczbacteria bacterium]|nr:hypothetical protein [Candidatus Staskawiczbacteria bacterium]